MAHDRGGGVDEAWQRLAAALGAEPPAGMRAMSPDHVGRLADAIDAAVDRDMQAIDEATERSLARVPALVRPAVRRIVRR